MSFEVLLAKSRGMCAGVDRAIRAVTLALDLYKDKKVYVHITTLIVGIAHAIPTFLY